MTKKDIDLELHLTWWRGYKMGAQTVVEAVERAMSENQYMPLRDLLVRIKVAILKRNPQVEDEQEDK